MATIFGIVFGLAAIGAFTSMLVAGYIGEATYVVLILASLLAALAIAGFPRLQELDLKGARIILREIRDVQQQVEKTKAEIAEMYGGIENLKREPLVLDKEKMQGLGLWGVDGYASGGVSMKYAAGCVKRERERLARIFVNEKSPVQIAAAILDSSMDDLVFKWDGPEAALDVPPKSAEERQARVKAKRDASSND